MIVDDMEIMRRELKGLKIWGERTGFIVSEEAKDGQDAIKKLKKQGRRWKRHIDNFLQLRSDIIGRN